MTPPARPGARPRTPLSRDRVLQAALALADASGIESLSMRKLGEAVGVEAMSLPADADGWKSAMRQRASCARAVLFRHRWAIALMESRTAPAPATLRHHDAVLGCLRQAGYDYASEYEYGLDLILDGLERALNAAGGSHAG